MSDRSTMGRPLTMMRCVRLTERMLSGRHVTPTIRLFRSSPSASPAIVNGFSPSASPKTSATRPKTSFAAVKSNTFRPLLSKRNETVGCASAALQTTSVIRAASAGSPRKNFRRAGTLLNNPRTSMVVPTMPAAGFVSLN